jgi:hypothetical protein
MQDMARPVDLTTARRRELWRTLSGFSLSKGDNGRTLDPFSQASILGSVDGSIAAASL